MSENVIVVHNTEEFYEALQNASGGERIELAPGDYGDIKLSNFAYQNEVVITSQSSDDLAKFNTVMLSHVSNLTFDNVYFDFRPDEETVEWSTALRADNSSNITVINSKFEGGSPVAGIPSDSEPGTQGPEGIDGYPIGIGMQFNWSQNIVIENNDVSFFSAGVRFNNVDNISFNQNEIYEFRNVPVGGGDVSNLHMENNYFHDSIAWKFGALGDHGDFVHFWTRSEDSTPSENLYFYGNVFDQGEGAAILGIYLEDNYDVGYKNVTIENNLIHNGNAQALRLENIDGLFIKKNSFIQSSGDAKDAPQIRLLYDNENVYIEDNIFAGVNGPDLDKTIENNININNNLVIQSQDPHAENYLGELFINSASSVFDLKAVPGTAADGIGSDFTQFNWSPEVLTPNFQVNSSASSEQILIFDASLTVGPEGLLNEGGTEFYWNFGDGSTATGQIVEHNFAMSGYHDVTLTIVTQDGETAQAGFTAGIAGDDIVNFDAQSGHFEILAYGEETALDSGVLPLVQSSSGYALKLGGEGTQASIGSSEISRLVGTSAFDFSMSLKADSASSWGEIARVHTSFTATVNQDGNFVLELFLDDGSVKNISSSGIPLNDGALHDVVVSFDGEAGFAKILIDGQVVASESVFGSLWGGPRSLDFGNPWGKQNFDGELSGFSLSAESRDFPIYSGDVELVSDSNAVTTEPTIDEEATAPSASEDVDATEETSAPNPVESDNEVPSEGEAVPEEEAAASAPLLLGGYELDVANISSNGTVKLYDDAHVVDTQTGSALSFDGEEDYASLGRLTEFEASQRIAFSVDFTTDATKSGTQNLVWNHMKLGLALEGDGIRVLAANKDNTFHNGFKIDGLNLNDGSQHTATVMVDSETNRLQLIVDDVLVLDEKDTDFDFVGAGGNEWGWSLGTAWNNWFDGQIHDFQVSEDFAFIEPATEDESTTDPDIGDVDATEEASAPNPVESDNEVPSEGEAVPEEEAAASAPLLLGGYELDVANISSNGTVKLYDDAHVVDTQTGSALSFDGKKDYASLGRLTEFEASQKIGFSIDFTSDAIKGGTEKLVWNHMKLGLSLEGDGIRVLAANNDDTFHKGFKIDGLSLDDGGQHTATVMVDAESDRLQVVIDDVLVLDEQETDFDFVGAGGYEWGWSLGTAWNNWFSGQVHEFQVSDDFIFIEQTPEDGTILA